MLQANVLSPSINEPLRRETLEKPREKRRKKRQTRTRKRRQNQRFLRNKGHCRTREVKINCQAQDERQESANIAGKGNEISEARGIQWESSHLSFWKWQGRGAVSSNERKGYRSRETTIEGSRLRDRRLILLDHWEVPRIRADEMELVGFLKEIKAPKNPKRSVSSKRRQSRERKTLWTINPKGSRQQVIELEGHEMAKESGVHGFGVTNNPPTWQKLKKEDEVFRQIRGGIRSASSNRRRKTR